MEILVISPSWVGDMMMSHTLYQQLKTNYPHCQIDVMAPHWCRALLDRMPQVRQAIGMPLGHGEFALRKRYELGKMLQNRYDLAIILPNSWKSALIPFFADIPQRRGWKGELRYGLLNDLRHNKNDYPMMVQRYIALAFEHNQVPTAAALPKRQPSLSTDADKVAQTKILFANLFVQAQNRPMIGFCPGAEFGPAKRYPHYHYATLAGKLIEQGYAVQLFGSQKDIEIGEQICQALPQEQQRYCLNFAGKTDLNQVVDLLSLCQGVVSNDSGLMHIAAALDRPLVALYGPTSPQYTPPLSEQATVIRLIEGGLIKVRKGKHEYGYHQSLVDIRPEQVFDTLMNKLQAG